MVIDNRLLDAKSEAQLIENFNRTLAMMDTIANVVADIEDSQLFKVIFDSDGGSDVSTQYVVEGEKAEQPDNPTKTGYDFDVWKKGNAEFDFDTPITEHTNLKASWTPTEYTITYSLDGGNLDEGVTNPTTYTIETSTFTINNPSKEGYIFRGWTGSNGETPQTELSVAKGTYGDLTYTANWQEENPEQGGTE